MQLQEAPILVDGREDDQDIGDIAIGRHRGVGRAERLIGERSDGNLRFIIHPGAREGVGDRGAVMGVLVVACIGAEALDEDHLLGRLIDMQDLHGIFRILQEAVPGLVLQGIEKTAVFQLCHGLSPSQFIPALRHPAAESVRNASLHFVTYH